jgi:LemA protein
MITFWIVVALLGIVGWVIYQFNAMVGLSNDADAAWAEIDSQLARRYELVAQLLALAKTATLPEATREQLAAARTAGLSAYTTAEKSRSEPPLVAAIEKVLAVSQTDPHLMANADFLQVQHTLTDIEAYLHTARANYHALAQDINTRSGQSLNRPLASLFGIERRDLFQVGA